MKKIARSIIIAGLVLFAFALMTYIAFAFINAEFNPFQWKQDDRTLLVFIVFICALVLPLILSEI